ncbi:hypothetical protein H072_7411 [Dactylellina haptotyla CBS 200.50]|uniref:Ig-like domain-containing protein n=1 Tax=Dactylellina haptotyla (strain CBS 200.50) TaxID=1284197 RepID=S8BU39_DACHA|nr:hypothetical protein H072_7411 [Dactylellina haptotyla CBS 200.50]
MRYFYISGIAVLSAAILYGSAIAQTETDIATVTVTSLSTINAVTTVASCGCFPMCSDVTWPTNAAGSGFNIIVSPQWRFHTDITHFSHAARYLCNPKHLQTSFSTSTIGTNMQGQHPNSPLPPGTDSQSQSIASLSTTAASTPEIRTLGADELLYLDRCKEYYIAKIRLIEVLSREIKHEMRLFPMEEHQSEEYLALRAQKRELSYLRDICFEKAIDIMMSA